jgi:hypothetical protein
VSDPVFELIEAAVATGGPAAAFDLLAGKFLAEQKYPQLFETRLMQKRLELGLPLIQLGVIEDLPEPTRIRYEDGVRQAAREAGTLFLSDGDIPHAWPYFRAIGEHEPVAEALSKWDSGGEIDALIEIALGQRVHPRKGLELVIAKHGICRAITYFEQSPDLEQREACWKLLVQTLHAEVVANLKHSIASREGQAPATNSIPGLMDGRDWLFGQFDTYADTAHVINVIRFSVDFEDREAIALAVELCDYGAHLSAEFKMRGEPPFNDIYRDYGIYLRALAGEDLDHAAEHFHAKIAGQDDPMRVIRAAQILISLLVRRERYREAIQIWLQHLNGVDQNRLSGPTLFQLCQLAGDSERMKELARERGDLLSFAAGAIQV